MNFKLILWLSCFLPIIKSQSVYNFKKIPTGFVILATDRNIQYRLASTKFYHMSRCFSACSQLQSCVIIQMSLTTCSYYSSNVQLRPGSDGSELWSKPGFTIEVLNNTDTSLTNYWPIIAGDTSDKIGSSSMSSSYPTYDLGRLGNQAGGIKVSDSSTYWTVTSGVYFSGPFTITAWIYLTSSASGSRFIDFSNGRFTDNVIVAINGQNDQPFVQLMYYGISPSARSGSSFPRYSWTHVAAFHDGYGFGFYLNGALQAYQSNQPVPVGVRRGDCYFGRSAFYEDGYPQATFDEIKIFNRSLSSTEILNDMNIGSLIYYWS